MAITQTGAIYKAFSFDNVSSRDYGVYITGEAVYNAPERDVEMISIPGRNGAYALDRGRFENIEVIYPAGIFADTETDFAQAVSDLRNYLCSKKGYFRLSDEYNPDEYRMAVYKSGLEVSPAQLKAGEFEIIFECKPQRWLTSGETATTVANNGTLTNPTLFESSPLLEVEGYGNIQFNGYEIKIENAVAGTVTIANSQKITGSPKTIPLVNLALCNNGDAASIGSTTFDIYVFAKSGNLFNVDTLSITSDIGTASFYYKGGDSLNARINLTGLGFNIGSAYTATCATVISGSFSSGVTFSLTYNITIEYQTSGSIIVSYNFVMDNTKFMGQTLNVNFGGVDATSTKSILGNPTYIDCDIGEAYLINSGVPISLNQYIDLGSDLPKLASGTNTFTKSNTVTQLKVTPRWWKV